MHQPIIDLHCDLLSYLAGDADHTPFDPQVRCSIPQMKDGHVRMQVLAIFAQTACGSAQVGLNQADIFKVITNQISEDLAIIQCPEAVPHIMQGNRIGIIAAFENASGFCEESEPLEEGLERLKIIFGKVGRPLYIGFTWNHENRFGGGALTDIGLKEDGKKLLEFLNGKHIAVDLSHASDRLAFEILQFIDQNELELSVLASHSNVRNVTDNIRNLPNELIQEISKRKGLIGLNCVRGFVGAHPDDFARHIEELLQLGAENSLAFGADFFFDGDVPKNTPGRCPEGWFFDGFGGSDCYPSLLKLLQARLNLPDGTLEKLAFLNACSFLNRLWMPQLVGARE
ncbi:MAG: membrane dipeptidase [Chlamydiales bacterium]|nr:membrane dipeptidase [Chlamydiales bacterium]